MPKFRRIITLSWVVCLLAFPAAAQWTSQTIELKAGWNAVFLEVEPYPAQCDTLLQNLPIKSVWTYDSNFSSVDFIQDLTEITPEMPQWRSYFPPEDPRTFTTNLFILEPGKSYLIEASQDTTWELVGKPRLNKQQWKPGEYNMVGFWVDQDNPPSFADWFSNSPAHLPLDIWTLSSTGNWQKITNTTTTKISRNKAYWVFCSEQTDFQAPVDIQLPQGTSLEYGLTLVEQSLEFQVTASSTRTLSITTLPSQPVLDPTSPALCGDVSLTWYGKIVQDEQNFSYGYSTLPTTMTIGPNNTLPQSLRLAIDRPSMPPSSTEGLYQSLLEVKSDKGFRRVIGLSAQKQETAGGKPGLRQTQSEPAAGLWVGNIVLNQVNNDGRGPTDTAAPFEYRVMLHVNEQGTVRLLNEVTQLFRPGTFSEDPQEPDLDVIDETGRYILYTPSAPQSLTNEVGDTVIPGAIRDGRTFARRISTAAYSLLDADNEPEEPICNSNGSFGVAGSVVSVTLTIEDKESTNPFHHKYHPQHGWSENSPDWTIDWYMQFTFTANSPDGRSVAGWGDSQVGGTFQQTLSGLVKESNLIKAKGNFNLQRVSIIPVLNDGL